MGNHIQYSADEELAQIIAETAPCSILALGPQAAQVFTNYIAGHSTACLTHIAAGDWLAPVANRRFDFVFLSQVLEQLRKPQACHLLARLRESSQCLYAKVPMGKAWLNHASFWEQNDLRGLGLDLVNLTAASGRPVGLFCYDVRTRKPETEWLNSKYWAQPD